MLTISSDSFSGFTGTSIILWADAELGIPDIYPFPDNMKVFLPEINDHFIRKIRKCSYAEQAYTYNVVMQFKGVEDKNKDTIFHAIVMPVRSNRMESLNPARVISLLERFYTTAAANTKKFKALEDVGVWIPNNIPRITTEGYNLICSALNNLPIAVTGFLK